MKKSFYSHGKLLLTSEYLVLDGVKALALPTKKGQWLTVNEGDTHNILWKSLDEKGDCWFETKIDLPISNTIDTIVHEHDHTETYKITKTLLDILQVAQELNPDFLSTKKGYVIETQLEFDRSWGLGSSSTLINNIAQWADIDPFELLKKSFGGSGYDIANAQCNTPIFYTNSEKKVHIEEAFFNPPFKDYLFFIYLNQKQDSKASITHYRSLPAQDFDNAAAIIKTITNTISQSNLLSEFNSLIDLHEKTISEIIKTPTVKSRLFSDYSGSIKSLGGWGGDFVLATGSDQDMNYFRNKGYHTIIPFEQMIL